MAYEINWQEGRGVYRRFHGQISDSDIEQSTLFIEASPHFDDLRYSILDFLEVKGFVQTNTQFIEEAAAIDSSAAISNPNIKVAIVATLPEIMVLAGEYMKHSLCPFSTRVFSSLSEAYDWASRKNPVQFSTPKPGI